MTKKVICNQPGIISVGEYLAGEEYEVDDDEAKRLVDIKGFEYVTTKSAATSPVVAEKGE